MKNLHLLIWVTQLGISIAAPLVGFVLLAVWLRNRFALGVWVILVGVGLGVIGAVDGLRSSLRTMEKLSQKEKDQEDKTTLSFHEHD